MNTIPSQSSQPATSVREIQMRAAEWVNQRRDSGAWSDADQVALDSWLTEAPAHRIAYWRLDAAWERSRKLTALQPLPREKTSLSPRGYLPILLKIAAAVTVAVLGAGTVYFQRQPQEHLFATAIGSRENITLADGTRIELNTNTALRISPDQKTVRLDRGEAYFEVKHDAARNFSVIANGHRIVDLGTKFSIRSSDDRLQVSLIEGRVRLDAPDEPKQESVLLMTGDVAVAKGNALTVARLSSDQLSHEIAWRRGMLVFSDTPLADAVTEFNRYNREKLAISDPRVALLKIDGTFPATDTALFTRAAQQLFKLHVERRGQDTVISR